MSELLLIETIRKKKIHWRTRDKAIKAIKRMSKDKTTDFRNSLLLLCSFDWSETTEGHDFWDKINEAGEK